MAGRVVGPGLATSNAVVQPLSQSTAAYLSVLYTIIYVAPFYLSSTTRPSPTLSRDSPRVIRARIRAVTASCVFTAITTACIAARAAGALDLSHTLHLFGWWPIPVPDLCRSFALVLLLFLGPLFEKAIVQGNWPSWLRAAGLGDCLQSSIGWRNYVAGPLTEEHTFRSMLLSLHLLSDSSPKSLVFITPLYFGLAHLHHAYEFRLTHPGIPLTPVVFRTLFQFAYTSVFGFYASFLYLRTGSVWSVFLAHAFCNWMGLPRLWGRVEGVPDMHSPAPKPIVGPDGKDHDGHDAARVRIQRPNNGILGMQWTVMYYVLLLTGAWGFYKNLWTLTESTNTLYARW